jgi:hypothetical protein
MGAGAQTGAKPSHYFDPSLTLSSLGANTNFCSEIDFVLQIRVHYPLRKLPAEKQSTFGKHPRKDWYFQYLISNLPPPQI